MSAKTQRQHRIARLLETEEVTSQTQLVELLAAEGVTATQATSRATSTTSGPSRSGSGAGSPSTPSPSCPRTRSPPEDHLRRVLGDWVVEVAHSHNLVVLRTPPGSAHVVASALDRSSLPEVLGTVAGDDTLIIVADERRSRARPWPTSCRELAGL